MQTELFHLHAEVELDHWWFVARRRIVREVLAAVLPPGPERRVVDVGCGTGANIAALRDDYTVAGIDTSEDAIELARERFPEIPFILGRAPADLGEHATDMDAFLLVDVLEHVPDATAVLAPLVRTLRPGGFALITVPADMRLWSRHDESFGHYRRYDVPTLRAVWADLPVTEIMVSYFNTRLYPVVRAVRTLNRIRGRAWGRNDSDLSIPPRPVNASLERLFAGERHRLVDLVSGRRAIGYSRGVSLIALLRREHDDDDNRTEAVAAPSAGRSAETIND